MSKLKVEYTDDNGEVFIIETKDDKFFSSHTAHNGGKSLSLADMTDEESYNINLEQATIIETSMGLAIKLGVIDIEDLLDA